ncbi:hypothetical protein ACQKM2_23110 [Streptomyces sp. NPDC004126]|uniref:hypothetical protein n=1 Tax=Streptomyces sp. NPDC004126 TaxID=3390695 RepID=UPI003D05EF87
MREAFLRPQAEGFLRLYPKRGAQVVPVPLSAGRDILQARMLLELFAFDSVAGRGDEAVRALGAELTAVTAVTEQHHAIAHALTSGDGAAARILLSEHLTAILRRLGLHDRPLTLPAPPAATA